MQGEIHINKEARNCLDSLMSMALIRMLADENLISEQIVKAAERKLESMYSGAEIRLIQCEKPQNNS